MTAKPVATVRSTQQRLIEFLDLYHAGTTDQLAALFWPGRPRLAQYHLRRLVESRRLVRHPHPANPRGPYVYRMAGRVPGQKTLHQLAAVDLYLAIRRDLSLHGVRSVPELSWSDSVRPDQTVWWKQTTWAVEHHLTGQFDHAGDYARFLERGDFLACHWWRRDLEPEAQTIGLLVITEPQFVEHVRARLRKRLPDATRKARGEPVFLWRIGTRANVLKNPGAYLQPPRAETR